MLANIKFKALEDLKMTRAEDDGVHYDYNEFLKDSSDDEKFVIKQADDDMNYQEAFSQDKLRDAVELVLRLANQQVMTWHEESEIESGSNQIQIVKEYFFNSGEAILNNSQIAKNDNDV
jgi:hypothetical protein